MPFLCATRKTLLHPPAAVFIAEPATSVSTNKQNNMINTVKCDTPIYTLQAALRFSRPGEARVFLAYYRELECSNELPLWGNEQDGRCPRLQVHLL